MKQKGWQLAVCRVMVFCVLLYMPIRKDNVFNLSKNVDPLVCNIGVGKLFECVFLDINELTVYDIEDGCRF